MTLTTGGAVSLVGDLVLVGTFNLNAAGNNFDLTGVTDGPYTVNGGVGVDVITGGEGADVFGDPGDTLNGGGADDTLTGGSGADFVSGGAGDDRMVITAQADIAAGETYDGGNGFDTLDLETGAALNIAALTINANVERLESSGAVSLKAGQLNKFTSVQTGAITLTNGGVVDLAGATVLTNTFNLNAAGNTLNLNGVTDTGYTVNGGTGVDIITGGDNNDVLVSGGGNDTLNGSFGNDSLTGGAGLDSFLFNTDLGATTNVDNVFNFNSVDDKVLLSGAVFRVGAIGPLAAAAFFTGAAANDSSDRIIYNDGTGALMYDPDGTGSTAATQFATLPTKLDLTNNNFQVV